MSTVTQPADRRNAYGFSILYTLNSLNWVCSVICIVYVAIFANFGYFIIDLCVLRII